MVAIMTRFSTLLLLFLLLFPIVSASATPAVWKCPPTPQDEIGPFYRPNAPVRSKIGSGYVLEGVVRSAATCKPVPGARVEFWQAGPDGTYSDVWRAAIITDRRGRYRLETAAPPPYARRPSHIHILVDMRGYAGLITQHYPKAGKRHAVFDLVMETE
jgi:protocatechuate 3,4-dioxygenase beta subunit